MSNKTSALLRLIRWNRPIGSLLLLWPTLWALWVAAEGVPDLEPAASSSRSGRYSCARRAASSTISPTANFDGGVTRTRGRPLVTGDVTVHGSGRVLSLCLCLAAFGLVLMTNLLTVLLSIPALALAVLLPAHEARDAPAPGRARYWPFPGPYPWPLPRRRGELPPALWLLFIGQPAVDRGLRYEICHG
jgi:4-hydroxybenzoate polyprenyltransferase